MGQLFDRIVEDARRSIGPLRAAASTRPPVVEVPSDPEAPSAPTGEPPVDDEAAMPGAPRSPDVAPPPALDARPAREAPEAPVPRPGPRFETVERAVAPTGSSVAAQASASPRLPSPSASPSRSPSPDPSPAAPSSDSAHAPQARPAPPATDAGAARTETRPVVSKTTRRHPPTDERALSRALAGAHLEVRAATPHARTRVAPAAPLASPTHTEPVSPDAAPARVVVAANDPDPLRAYLRAAPLAPTPAISPAAAVAGDAARDIERAAVAPFAQPQAELHIDRIDVQVVGEPPAPSDQRAPVQSGPPARSGAWDPAARYYLGRLS